MKNLIKYKEGKNSFFRWIKKRIKHNLNFISLFQGSPGVGKTWSAISMAHSIDPDFEARQIAFDFDQFMNIINDDWFRAKKWKIVIWDEPQCSISNRSWQSVINKMLNYVLSTFRHQNIILIFCCPYRDFLDSQSMKLIHCIFDCKGVDRKKKLSKVRPKLQQYNSKLKKTYEHALYVIKNHRVTALRNLYIKRPPQHLIDAYEQDREKFTLSLNLEVKTKIDEISGKSKLAKEGKKALTERQEEIMKKLAELIKDKRKAYKVAEALGCSVGTIHATLRTSRTKGWSISDFVSESH